MTLGLPIPYAFTSTPPKNCMATAAHQIEGHNFHSDWWEFESKPGNIRNKDTANLATDFWNHAQEDIQNMKSLGVNLYRYSVEWAKIEPQEGKFSEKDIQRYVWLFDELKKNGIDSSITFHHFTFPKWLSDQGGWEWDQTPIYFERFIKKMLQAYGKHRMAFSYTTLNEPMTVIVGGYLASVFPPQKKNFFSIFQPMTQMVRAHAKAYHAIHAYYGTQVRVGLAHHLRPIDPYDPQSKVDTYLAHQFSEIFNWAIPNATKTGKLFFPVFGNKGYTIRIPEAENTQDFFGFNYYSRDLIRFQLWPLGLDRPIPETAQKTDLNWEIYPEGMLRVIRSIHQRFPTLKLHLLETGIADTNDFYRISFLGSHFEKIKQGIKDGIPIETVCHWTLNDNFEWAEGYFAKFGLFSIVPKDQRRIPKASKTLYRSLFNKYFQ